MTNQPVRLTHPLAMPPIPPRPATARRSRTPEEAVGDIYVAMANVHALRGVTEYGLDTVAAVDRRRQAIAEELPEVNELLAALEINCARLVASVQNRLLNDEREVILP